MTKPKYEYNLTYQNINGVFMVHNENVVLEFHSRICTAINAYNIFSNEIIKNQFSEKNILLSNTVCQ